MQMYQLHLQSNMLTDTTVAFKASVRKYLKIILFFKWSFTANED